MGETRDVGRESSHFRVAMKMEHLNFHQNIHAGRIKWIATVILTAVRQARNVHFCFAVLLSTLASGCITESTKGYNCRCCITSPIVERYGEYSQENDTISVSLKKLQFYYYEPFWQSNVITELPLQTFTYSLSTPTSDAYLCQWTVVPDMKAPRFKEKRIDVLDENATYSQSGKWHVAPDDYPRQETPFILPLCPNIRMEPLLKESTNTLDKNPSENLASNQGGKAVRVYIHADDIHYLSGPFLSYDSHSNIILLIPYKNENGVIYLYSPKDSNQAFMEPYRGWRLSAPYYIWRTILPTITIVLDIVLLPVEAVGFLVYCAYGMSVY